MRVKKPKPRWSVEEVIEALGRDDSVHIAILQIYGRQTEDEKLTRETKHHNRRGFSQIHAPLGSYLANYILEGRQLTGKWLAKARALSKRYAKQLVDIATHNGRGLLVCPRGCDEGWIYHNSEANPCGFCNPKGVTR